ncbi:GNAT family N-acetyltransferase [Rhizobium mayense]|uniref:GNAT family N-acetyltransferase n=1 Tax=Rhizobium mayense TaxID=1312184 RepID=A0ABT7JMM7_9HYPH|nr:GNAT family N-acetyltransferase [Rhizobium mayense]MDL2397606.1 GNAT family N-acetyltransferase [Rhizobium mayense]
MTVVETPRLILRPCQESDRDLFYELSSDPLVLEFFPFRRSREDADAVFDIIIGLTPEEGFELLVLVLKQSGESIGFSGLSKPKLETFLPADAVEIGWRLSARHWRRGYASEAGVALLRHGFEALGLDEIMGVAVHDNDRALAVMQRIGMRREPTGDFDHPDIPASHPELRRHVLYRLSAADWRRQQIQPAEG